MIDTKDCGPAFPIHPGAAMDGQLVRDTQGMTLRDKFADSVLPSIYADAMSIGKERGFGEHWRQGVASEAYKIADAMLKEREK